MNDQFKVRMIVAGGVAVCLLVGLLMLEVIW